jgi:hypothetical protein
MAIRLSERFASATGIISATARFDRLGGFVSVHQRLGDRFQGIPFEAIVGEDE